MNLKNFAAKVSQSFLSAKSAMQISQFINKGALKELRLLRKSPQKYTYFFYLQIFWTKNNSRVAETPPANRTERTFIGLGVLDYHPDTYSVWNDFHSPAKSKSAVKLTPVSASSMVRFINLASIWNE